MKKCFIIAMCLCTTLAFARSPHHRGHRHHRGGDGGGDSHIRLGGMDYIHITDFTKLPERVAFLY